MSARKRNGETMASPPSGWSTKAVAMLTALGLLNGSVIGFAVGTSSAHRRAPAEATTVTRTSAPTAGTATAGTAGHSEIPAACATAIAGADQSLAHAVQIDKVLSDQLDVMGRLLSGRIPTQQALVMAMPSLLAGSTESAKFNMALARYHRMVQRCRLK